MQVARAVGLASSPGHCSSNVGCHAKVLTLESLWTIPTHCMKNGGLASASSIWTSSASQDTAFPRSSAGKSGQRLGRGKQPGKIHFQSAQMSSAAISTTDLTKVCCELGVSYRRIWLKRCVVTPTKLSHREVGGGRQHPGHRRPHLSSFTGPTIRVMQEMRQIVSL